MKSKAGRNGMPLFVMIAVVLTLMSSLFVLGSVHAAIDSPVLQYELTGQNVNLTWGVVPNATLYNIYSSTDNETFSLIGNTTNTYFVHTQPWNTTCYYYVTAVNGANESAHSNVVKVITPAGNSSSGAGAAGAGFGVGTFNIPVYKPYLWLGVIFMFFGIMLLLAARAASGKHRIAEFWGVLFLFIGAVIVLASVAVVYFHML